VPAIRASTAIVATSAPSSSRNGDTSAAAAASISGTPARAFGRPVLG